METKYRNLNPMVERVEAPIWSSIFQDKTEHDNNSEIDNLI
jgi:hypothetical protein